MGRTNGKLTTFLKDALQNDSFCNLKWQDENSQVFTLKLPRFEKSKDLKKYEKVLMEWYAVNNREYLGYSQAKAVIQAALKKSVYLVSLGRTGIELSFRFATKDEEQEKRRKQASESNLIHRDRLHKESETFLYEMNIPSVDPLPSPSIEPEIFLNEINIPSEVSLPSPNPPPSDSSGYQSGSEDFDENLPAPEKMSISEDNGFLDALEDLLKNPDNFIDALNNINLDTANTFLPNDIIEDSISTMSISSDDIIENSIDTVPISSHMIENSIDTVPISSHMIENSIDTVPISSHMIENSIDTVPISPNIIEDKLDALPFGDIKLNSAKIFHPFNEIPEKPVIELTATKVNSSIIQHTYWLCTRKIHIDSTLLLICEKQVILSENHGITEGQIYLNNVLEPGESYDLQKMFEFDGKCFLFLLRNN